MGVAGAIVYQSNLTYVAVFAPLAASPGLFEVMGAIWATRLVIGGLSARLSLSTTTPPGAGSTLGPDIPVLQRLTKIDPAGVALNMASPVLFTVALEFSDSSWTWDSGTTIAVWVVFDLITFSWVVQQWFCIFSTATERSIPLHLLKRLDLLPLWIPSGCAGASYTVTLYYTPLFFSFASGHSALQQAVRILPFILVFIFIVILVGGSLPIIGRYNIIYLIAGLATVSGSAAMAETLSPTLSEAQVMGLEALIGVGLGCSFQHGVGISNPIDKDLLQSDIILHCFI
ncbi:hypothetical protein BJX63DRAFT_434685 [Aspergillus granulosus]|uniref:Uncharacterized protein n=1 Tax=Aspergillus granulosus TaxID=176169 RepID=A0ABR4H3M1_9EURO